MSAGKLAARPNTLNAVSKLCELLMKLSHLHSTGESGGFLLVCFPLKEPRGQVGLLGEGRHRSLVYNLWLGLWFLRSCCHALVLIQHNTSDLARYSATRPVTQSGLKASSRGHRGVACQAACEPARRRNERRKASVRELRFKKEIISIIQYLTQL